MMVNAVSDSTSQQQSEDDQYQALLGTMRSRFAGATAALAALFTTDATGLFDAFLMALPADRRQHYTCNACRRFVDRFGGLVAISADGRTTPVLWDPDAAPPFFRASVLVVARLVARAKVSGMFLTSERTWGLPQNKSEKAPFLWKHMAVTPAPALVFKATPLLTAEQKIAERREEYGMLCRGLAEFPVEVVRQAHTLLTTGQLFRSEKCINVAKWLLDLHEARETAKGAQRDNLTWSAVAVAPAGFCHVRSGMIGTLLEDVQAGLPFADIRAKFDAKMDPLKYQRPQAAPSAGNIAQAEKVMASLGSAGALARRFAKVEEIEALWRPRESKPEAPAGGVFSHLLPKGKTHAKPQIETPPVTMTWEKFQRTVLPEAETIEFYAPALRASYFAFVTAANPEAPPILQWDREEKRNPFSVYVYHGGSFPDAWNLTANTWHKVTAVTLRPHAWYGQPLSHQGESVFFILSGAYDVRYTCSGGLFPETLRSEYHGIRATIEAYARTAVIAGKDEATACGIGLSKGSGEWNHLFRVTSKGAAVTYRLDRWD